MRRLKSCLSVSWLFFLCVGISYAADSLRAGKFMRDYEFLESSNKRFQLLFFTHDPYINRYVTIQRYLGIQDMNFREIDNAVKTMMVWVANPKNPLNDSSGVLSITQDGNLVITDHNGLSIALYSGHRSPAMSSAINTSTLTLLDSGNLVLRAGDERIVWQSFDYPTDTWLPGMKLGLFDLNTVKPRQQFLTSWVSPEVRAPGAFTLGIDPNNTKQLVVRRRGVLYWSSGMWNGHNFTYFPNDELIGLSYFSNERESYFTYSMTTSSYYLSSLIVMHSSGTLYSLKSNSNIRIMDSILQCDADGVEETSKGCTKPEPSKCRGGDAFNRTSGQMSGYWGYWNIGFNYSLALSDCKEICRRNCSCNAYEYDGYNCLLYGGQVESLGGQHYFFLRNGTAPAVKGIPTPRGHPNTSTAPSDSPNTAPPDLPRRRKLWVTIGGSFASLVVLAALSLFCYLRYGNWLFGGMKKDGSCKDGMKKRTKQLMNGLSFNITGAINDLSAQKQGLIGKEHELPLFSFHSIQFATDHFSEAKKIGQGGFGPVYKGKLVGGQEIAVKRLSRSSRQGSEEFKNEVILISKLQHRNLVRLLGCCTHGDERILVYEYLHNNSLDSFLFDATKRALLDWKLRLCIIEGIAQGLLYLHKYSRLRIIHRDLKASNILLDNNMNPKISDFGTARIFGENESRANTSRIVGTYGYMSPEYAMDGLFSEKSDVFSFGVMTLEIISGKRNTGIYQPDHCLNLLGYAWDLWKEGRGMELMDQELAETCRTREVFLRYVQVGLLCVQESAADRPIMSNVVSMLSNEMMVLPAPKKPAFCATVCSMNYSNSPQPHEPCSNNEIHVSSL